VKELGPLDEEDEQDIVQTVVAKLQDPGVFARVRGADSPVRYLFSIVRKAMIDVLRHKRHVPYDDEKASVDTDMIVSVWDDENAETAELAWQLLEPLLPCLSHKDQQLVTAQVRERLSLEQIASRYKMPKGAVSTRLYRARRRMRAAAAIREGSTKGRGSAKTRVVDRINAAWRAWRGEQGRSWTKLAQAAGIPGPTLSRIRRGKTVPRRATIKKLSKTLRVSADWLAGDRADLPHVPEWHYSDALRTGPSNWEQPSAQHVRWSYLMQETETAVRRDLKARYGPDADREYEAWGHRIIGVISHLCEFGLWRVAAGAGAYSAKDNAPALDWIEQLFEPWFSDRGHLGTELVRAIFTALLTHDAGFEFMSEANQAEMRDGALEALGRLQQTYYDRLAADED